MKPNKTERNQRALEQFNGSEAETAALFGTLSIIFYIVAGGFRPRHFRRSTFPSRSKC